MARHFTKNTANYMSLGTNAIGPLINGAPAVSVSMWFDADSYNGGSSTADDLFTVMINGNTVGLTIGFIKLTTIQSIRAGARSVSTDTFRFLDSTAVTTGKHHVGVVFDFGLDNIRIYLDGSQVASGITGTWANATYTNGTATTVDGIGATFSGSTPSSTVRQFDGRISHVAVFDADIGSDRFAELAAGFSAEMISPDSLVSFFLMDQAASSNEKDHWGGLTGAITGTIGAAEDPPIIYPAGVLWVRQAAAGGGGATPWLYARQPSRIIGGGIGL